MEYFDLRLHLNLVGPFVTPAFLAVIWLFVEKGPISKIDTMFFFSKFDGLFLPEFNGNKLKEKGTC